MVEKGAPLSKIYTIFGTNISLGAAFGAVITFALCSYVGWMLTKWAWSINKCFGVAVGAAAVVGTYATVVLTAKSFAVASVTISGALLGLGVVIGGALVCYYARNTIK
jgi:MFS family permease